MEKNWQALRDFIKDNRIEQGPDGRWNFDALVNFKSDTAVAHEHTDVRISLRNGDKQVVLAETSGITAERIHTEFLADFQNFQVRDKALIIRGSSPKLGAYVVEITMP